MNDFLNPKSMLTPGIAGFFIMGITNALWVAFAIPQNWSALLLSFLILFPILKKFSVNFFQKFIYFIFNGLIIFAMAVSTNAMGVKIANRQDTSASSVSEHEKTRTAEKLPSPKCQPTLPTTVRCHSVAHSYHKSEIEHPASANTVQRKFFEPWPIF